MTHGPIETVKRGAETLMTIQDTAMGKIMAYRRYMFVFARYRLMRVIQPS